ncbi:MAG: hypothetical protein BWY06_01952 [Candidatus Latescibacteria bacterium ADurb.Bin168]|nr:MAG: hypothetical protein BWY06_01952 [Candidatus Latescibacteria bacterium ADurb.Bin168]
MIHEILVYGRIVCDQHYQGAFSAPSRPTGLLPCAGDRAGVTDQNAGFERAYIYSEFERVGADYAEELTFEKLPFDFSTFFRQIPPAIGPHPTRE